MYKNLTKTVFAGNQVYFLPSCHSTNDFASDFVTREDVPEGTVVITDNQVSGKGQRGNFWESEAGENLTLSLILRPVSLDIKYHHFLNIAVSLGILELLKGYLNEGLMIKWPNDVYYNDKKIGALLIENNIKNNRIETSIVGIGINVNQKQFEVPTAISLSQVTGRHYKLPELFQNLMERVESRILELRSNRLEELKKDYLDNLYWLNETHTFRAGKLFQGVIKGIDQNGRLVLLIEGEEMVFEVKEIEFVA